MSTLIIKLLYLTKNCIKGLIRYKNYFTWSTKKSKKISTENFHVHVLVVKKINYVKLSRTAILSFLYFHPNSKITVHCDHVTYLPVKKILKKYIGKKSIHILDDCDSSFTWQQSKLQLILQMNGTKDCFMDADLRWNGPISKQIRNVIFFVNEFKFQDRSPYRQLGHVIEKNFGLKNLHMHNTSFFSFGGVIISLVEIQKTLDFSRDMQLLCEAANLGKDDLKILERLSEQVALSVCSLNWANEIKFLKDQDAIFDGSFVESSYFGATGNIF